MFLNLFDEEVPAAMVVFDKITSTNPSFEKTWLLHTHTKPTTIENRTVSYATEGEEEWGESFQGKLTVDHLLPKLDDMTIETVGSEEEGFQTIDGVQYDSTAPYIGENSVQSTYRLEISPKTQKETDYFLNVLQVTDKETSGYENVKMLETDSLYGVSIKDRVVYFSKSGERENSFTINDNSLAGNKKYTFCDAQAGVWEVSTNGNTFNINVTEDGGVLSFDSISGNIRAERKTDLDINIEEINPDDYLTGEIKNPNLSDKDRDIMLTYQQDYVYMENKPVIIDNKLMVDADRIAEVMGLEVERLNDSQIKLYCPQQNIAITLNIDSTVYEDNGVTMVELTTITDFFNHQTWWDELTKTVHLIPKRINFIPTNISVKWYGDSTSISEEHTFEISNSKIDIFLTKTKDELEKKITSQAQRLSIDLEFEGSARSNEDGTTVDFTVIPNKEFDINKYNSVIAAFYNNKGTLLDCKAVVINENVGLASSDIKADYVKLFFWRNRNFSPRAMSKTINVIAN